MGRSLMFLISDRADSLRNPRHTHVWNEKVSGDSRCEGVETSGVIGGEGGSSLLDLIHTLTSLVRRTELCKTYDTTRKRKRVRGVRGVRSGCLSPRHNPYILRPPPTCQATRVQTPLDLRSWLVSLARKWLLSRRILPLLPESR